MLAYLSDFFASGPYMPHGICLSWEPALLALHIGSDAVITLAYFTIPGALLYFVHRRQDLAYPWLFLLFGVFILGCGSTHLMGIWVLWHPDYAIDGLVKLVTAIASIGTAIAVWWLMPDLLALPSTGQLEQRVRAQTAELTRTNRDLAAEIAAREQAQHALAASERRFRDFASIASDWLWETDAEHRFTYVSARSPGPTDDTPALLLGRRRDELDIVDPAAPGWQAHLDALAARQPFRNLVYAHRSAGPVRYVRISGQPLFAADGTFHGYRGAASDVTAEIEADQRADRAHRLLQDAVESLPAALMMFDRDERLVLSNTRCDDLFPGAGQRLRPGTTAEAAVHLTAMQQASATSEAAIKTWTRERLRQLRRGDGSDEQALADGRRLQVFDRRTSEGGVVSIHLDVTDRKLAEEQLRQAQRMEAIGQLTGGIAHDFNNLLTVIVGRLEIIVAAAGKDGPIGQSAASALEAADRGAALTRRLLAFARRQPLQPVAVDLNALVNGMSELLRRSLGETTEIQLNLASGLWPTLADPGEVENALLNLAINARDAMPKGGQLIIETANMRLDEDYVSDEPDVTVGDYVMLAVTDTGSGMPPEVAARAFEPFFTTKEPGRGSGLGLSTIYGFARQSGGHVKIYSEPGLGTTIRLFLPKAATAADAAAPPMATETKSMRRSETVLVVEDDPQVRRLAVQIVADLGCRVFEAGSGAAALALVREHAEIDLLFTDVVMPGGMSGIELAEAAQRLRPGLKVLLTSGFTEAAAALNDGRRLGFALLGKPYRRHELATRLAALFEPAAG